jgi:hypothetical protein
VEPKNDRVEPRPTDEGLASIAGSPETHVITGSSKHDVAVRRAAGCRAAVRSTEDDVHTWTAVDDVVAVQSKGHVIARPAFDDVGAIERLVRRCTSLNIRVVGIVVVQSNEELRPLAAFNDCRLRAEGWAENNAHYGGQEACRQGRQTEPRD